MAKDDVSVDEFLAARKDFVKSGDVLVKGSSSGVPSWDSKNRTARFVMTSQSPDRDNDVIHQDGIAIDRFLENPQGLLFHNSRSWPIGMWQDVAKVSGRPKRHEGVLKVLPEGGPIPEVDQAAWMMEHGGIRTVSIGFIPKTIKRRQVPDEKKDDPYYWAGYDILEAELVECSLVPIPAQPDAIAKHMADGNMKLAASLIEEVLDTYVKHPETKLLMTRESYEASLKQATGERTTVVVKDPPPEAPVVVADPTPSGNSDGPQSQTLFRRAMTLLLGPDAKARADAALQEALAEAEAQEKAEAARKAALETRRAEQAQKLADLNARLAQKGLISSAHADA